MENREELLTEVLRRVQQNYKRMVEIERLTRELGEALSRSDQDSAQILLRMRKDELDGIARTRDELRMIVKSQDPETCAEIEALFAEGEAVKPKDAETSKIQELNRLMMQVKAQTIALDKAISSKVARTDSYYYN